MGEPVERLERPVGAVLEDQLGPWDPVVKLGRDQVADDVARRPAAGCVGRVEPAVGQAVEQPAHDPRRALEQRPRVGQEAVGHGGIVARPCEEHSPVSDYPSPGGSSVPRASATKAMAAPTAMGSGIQISGSAQL